MADDFDFSVWDARTEAQLRSRLSPQAQAAVVAEVRKFAESLAQSTLKVVEESNSDCASAKQVRAVAAILTNLPLTPEGQKNLATFGGIFFGCAFCYAFSAAVGAAVVNTAAFLLTFLVGSLGSFLMARERPLRFPGFLRRIRERDTQGAGAPVASQSAEETPAEEKPVAHEVPAKPVPTATSRSRGGSGSGRDAPVAPPIAVAAAPAQPDGL